MVSWAGIKIACLVSWLTITRIVSNLENNGSLLINGIPWSFGDRELLERFIRLVTLRFISHTSGTRLAELLYISTEAGLEIFTAN